MSSDAFFYFFFFNDTATTEIYTLSLHDALPISLGPARDPRRSAGGNGRRRRGRAQGQAARVSGDRKSTRLNSSHSQISYAVFCLKKKKKARNTAQHKFTSKKRRENTRHRRTVPA